MEMNEGQIKDICNLAEYAIGAVAGAYAAKYTGKVWPMVLLLFIGKVDITWRGPKSSNSPFA